MRFLKIGNEILAPFFDSTRYRVLAVATDDEKKANREIESTKKPGKKVTVEIQ